MFDFVRLPNPIERLEFDWVRLVFCSVLFDWIGRDLISVVGTESTWPIFQDFKKYGYLSSLELQADERRSKYWLCNKFRLSTL